MGSGKHGRGKDNSVEGISPGQKITSVCQNNLYIVSSQALQSLFCFTGQVFNSLNRNHPTAKFTQNSRLITCTCSYF